MKVCLTGATGYIGSHLLQRLLLRQIDLKILVRRQQDIHRLDPIVKNHSRISYHFYSDGYTNLFEKGDIVVHLAALQAGNGITDEEYDQVNYGLVEDLVQASPNDLGLFIFVSTIRVYGNHKQTRINEKSPNLGTNRYALSKAKAERFLEENRQVPYCILQPTIVYGPNTRKGLMLKLIRIAKIGLVPLVDSGRNVMNFIYIDDLIDIMERAIFNHEKVTSQKLIVGYPEDVSMSYLFETLCPLLQKRCYKFKVSKNLLLQVAKLGLITKSQVETFTATFKVDPMEIYKILNLEPKTNLSDGLRKTILP
ncbi:MAG: NAD-dependent epimerase/dehydratase family protein [Ardenticatenaceae bacterium]